VIYWWQGSEKEHFQVNFLQYILLQKVEGLGGNDRVTGNTAGLQVLRNWFLGVAVGEDDSRQLPADL